MKWHCIKGWNILKNCALIIIMLGSVWSKFIYEMISKIISMCIKHKYAKRNFLAEGTFVFILPKLCSSFCKASSDATSESGKGQSVLRNSPAKTTRMGCHFLIQEIFGTQGLNSSLLHSGQILYCLNHQESFRKSSWTSLQNNIQYAY